MKCRVKQLSALPLWCISEVILPPHLHPQGMEINLCLFGYCCLQSCDTGMEERNGQTASRKQVHGNRSSHVTQRVKDPAVAQVTAVVEVQSPPWELPQAMNTAKRKKKKKCSLIFFFYFLWPRLWHMEVPRPGVALELQLRPVPQLRQYQILNPLSKARDQTHILTNTMLGS